MLAKDRLKIKVALVLGHNGYPVESKDVHKQGIFHQKWAFLKTLMETGYLQLLIFS